MPQVAEAGKNIQQLPQLVRAVIAEDLQLVVQARKEIRQPQRVMQILVPAVADQDFKMVLVMEHLVLAVVA